MRNSIVENLITEAIAENPKLFLIDWEITPDNKINVFVDGDEGLPIDEVVRISRHIEHNLDREEEDFSLTVSSPGVDKPLTMPRQYIKNIGRKLKVKTSEDEFKGEIIDADQQAVTLKWKTREPKPVGKGKHTVVKEERIPYDTIEKATIQLDI